MFGYSSNFFADLGVFGFLHFSSQILAFYSSLVYTQNFVKKLSIFLTFKMHWPQIIHCVIFRTDRPEAAVWFVILSFLISFLFYLTRLTMSWLFCWSFLRTLVSVVQIYSLRFDRFYTILITA